MKNKIEIFKLIGKWGITASFFIYCLVIIIHVYEQAKIKTLNHIMPVSFNHLLEIGQSVNKISSGSADKKDEKVHFRLKEYERYYRAVTHYMPQYGEAHGMYGFCAYYLGKERSAIASYKRAIALTPDFFYFNNNLGIIYFQKGDYERAVEMFKKAIRTSPEKTLKTVLASKIYRQIMVGNPHLIQRMAANWIANRQETYQMLILSLYQLHDFSEMFLRAQEAIQSGGQRNGFFYYYAGLAAYELKDYSKAAAFLAGCLKREYEHPDTLHYLGLSLKNLGQEDMADNFFKRAAELRASKNALLSEEIRAAVKLF